MGGVITDIPINYLQTLAKQLTIRGSFMHPASAASDILMMVNAGLLDLGRIKNTVSPLQEINQVIAAAAVHRGLSYCTINPTG